MVKQLLPRIPQTHPWREDVHYLEQTDSTNDRAKALAREGAPHGTVVIAGHQTAGKGRLGRSFHSPGSDGLYISFLLRFPCGAEELMHLTCAAAVAACEAVEKASGLRPGIKWTNDLVIGSKKLGGILTELITQPDSTCAIIGIGINCLQRDFPPEIADMACSLATAGAEDISPASVAAALIESMEQIYRQLFTDRAGIMDRYRADCITVGKTISILQGATVTHALATGIDETGGLTVRYEDGRTDTVRYGEVSIRGMYGYV